jgi:hypothetical protein
LKFLARKHQQYELLLVDVLPQMAVCCT